MPISSHSAAWGPLGHPVREQVAPGSPPWRDNAYLAFWTPDLGAYGCFHVSTSPNAGGRRSRLSLAVGGAVVELVEELDAGTFATPSIRFDLGDKITVDSARLSGSLRMQPLFALACYSERIIPGLEGGTPLSHFQRAVTITADLEFDGTPVEFEAVGVRDRTWGSRDESVSIDEYIGVMAVLDDCAITVIRMRTTAGTDLTEGFVLTEDGADPIVVIDEITRDGSGLFAECELERESGDRIRFRNTGRSGGFWVPMGWRRKGPVMSAYDEFDHVDAGELGTGAAMIEQGSLRTL